MATVTLTQTTMGRYFGTLYPAQVPSDVVYTDAPGNSETLDFTMGELLAFTNEFEVDLDIRNHRIFFSAMLFTPTYPALASNYFTVDVPGDAATNDEYEMTWQGPYPSSANWKCRLKVLTIGATSTYEIIHTFVATMDVKSYFPQSPVQGHDYLLKVARQASAELNNLSDIFNVYNGPLLGQYRFKTKILLASTVMVVETFFPTGTMRMVGKWYGKNNANTSPDIAPATELKLFKFDSPTWTTQSCLSPWTDQRIRFKVLYGLHTLIGATFLMIRTDTLDNSVDWLTDNYHCEPLHVQTVGGTSNINTDFKAPSQAWAATGGPPGEYWVWATVRRDQLVLGAKYRFIAVAYTDDDTILQSYISDEYSVCTTPDATAIAGEGSITDYSNQADCSITSAIQERMLARIVSTDINMAAWKVLLNTKFGVGKWTCTPRQVRLQSARVVTPTIYWVYEQKIWNFAGWVWDNAEADYVANFGATGNNLETGTPAPAVDINRSFRGAFNGISGAMNLSKFYGCYHPFRNRYEANVPAQFQIEFVWNGFTYIPVVTPNTGDQYWGGHIVYHQWEITLEYEIVMPDGTTYKYGDKLQWNMNNTVRDFESNQATPLMTVQLLDAVTEQPIENICTMSGPLVIVRATLDGSVDGLQYQPIVLHDFETPGIQNVQELDSPSLYNPIPYRADPPWLLSIDGDFGGDNQADALVDTTNMNISLLHYLTMIAVKKGVPSPAPANIQLREDGDWQLREDFGIQIRE